MVTWVYTYMKIKERNPHTSYQPHFKCSLHEEAFHIGFKMGSTLLGSNKGKRRFRLSKWCEKRLGGREAHQMSEKICFPIWLFLRLWIRKLKNSLENIGRGYLMKDLECQYIKTVLNSATENYSRFLSKLHFKKCWPESGLLQDCRGSPETRASGFLIITKLEARSNQGLH